MTLEQAVEERLADLIQKIEHLHATRQDLVGQLKSIDLDIHSSSKIISELSDILAKVKQNDNE